jgi:hypothetical protein
MTPRAISYLSENAEKWAKLCKLCEAADDAKARALLIELDLSPKLARLFTEAVSEEKELAATVAAGEGAAEQLKAADDELFLLRVIPATTREQIQQTSADRARLLAECLAARRAIDAADRARIHRTWLRKWLAELWGEVPPPHAGYLSGLQPSPKTAEIAANLGCDLWTVGAWRKQTNNGDQPKRKFVSFSPLIAKSKG